MSKPHLLAESPEIYDTLQSWGSYFVDNLFVDKRVNHLALSLLTIVSVGTGAAVVSLAFPPLVALLPLGGLLFGGGCLLTHAFVIYCIHRFGTHSRTALRVDLLFKHTILHLLVSGSLLWGAALSSVLLGAASLFHGTLLSLIEAGLLSSLSFGFLFPLGRLLLAASYEIDEENAPHFMESLKAIFLHAIDAGGENVRVALSLFFNDLLLYLDHLFYELREVHTLLQELGPVSGFSEAQLRTYLQRSLPHAALQTLHFLLDHAGGRISLNFLFKQLSLAPAASRQKLSRLLEERMQGALKEKGVLQIEEIWNRHRLRQKCVNDRRRDYKWRGREIDPSQLEGLKRELENDIRLVDRALARLQPFFAQDLLDGITSSSLPLELTISLGMILSLKESFISLQKELYGSVREQLTTWRNRLLPKELPEEAEPAYIVLCSRGLRVADFESLAERLGLPSGDEAIKEVHKRLVRSGLFGEKELLKEKILPSPSSAILQERLFNYLKKEKSHLFDWERIARVVESLAKGLFIHVIPSALVGCIVYSAPLMTALGLALGLFATWQPVEAPPSPPFRWNLSELSRSLCYPFLLSRILLISPPLGGLLSGLFLSSDLSRLTLNLYHHTRRHPALS